MLNDNWIPACNGLEQPFTVNGTRWLYVWNPAMRKHGYLNLSTDIVEIDVNFHPAQSNYMYGEERRYGTV